MHNFTTVTALWFSGVLILGLIIESVKWARADRKIQEAKRDLKRQEAKEQLIGLASEFKQAAWFEARKIAQMRS